MVLSVIGVFGLSFSGNLDGPAQNTLRQLRLGFVERGDIYGLFTMSAGCFKRIAIFLHGVCECLGYWFSNTGKEPGLPVCLLTLGLSLFVFRNHAELMLVLKGFYQYGFIVMLLPVLLLLRLQVKKGQVKSEGNAG